MTNIEGWLLERMTVRRWLATVVGLGAAGFGIGWNAGQRHAVNEVAAQVRESVSHFKEAVEKALPETSPEDRAAVQRQQANALARLQAQRADEHAADEQREALRQKMKGGVQ